MDTLFQMTKHVFSQGKEIEFRLGRVNGSYFDTNVGKEAFDRILQGLQQYTQWEQVKNEHSTVYYKDHLRVTINEETAETTNIKKIPLFKDNLALQGYPLDVRLAVSDEIPVPAPDENECMEFSRTKKRISFVRKNLSIDMTVVSGQADDLDCEEESVYQVELEIIDTSAVKSDTDLYNLVHKVHCVQEILLNCK
jgi:hypothetical protein